MDFLYRHINRAILNLKFQQNITSEIPKWSQQHHVTRKHHSHSYSPPHVSQGEKRKAKKHLAQLCH